MEKVKLICINSYGCENSLTIGKTYEGVEDYNDASYFRITDDEGTTDRDYYCWRFTTIEEWRAQQLDKILL